jgi:hypothetical protein
MQSDPTFAMSSDVVARETADALATLERLNMRNLSSEDAAIVEEIAQALLRLNRIARGRANSRK